MIQQHSEKPLKKIQPQNGPLKSHSLGKIVCDNQGRYCGIVTAIFEDQDGMKQIRIEWYTIFGNHHFCILPEKYITTLETEIIELTISQKEFLLKIWEVYDCYKENYFEPYPHIDSDLDDYEHRIDFYRNASRTAGVH